MPENCGVPAAADTDGNATLNSLQHHGSPLCIPQKCKRLRKRGAIHTPPIRFYSMMLNYASTKYYCSTISLNINHIKRCFSNWVPQRGVRGSERRKMRYGVIVLLAVLDLNVRIEIRVAPFDTNPTVTDSTQTSAASVQKIPDPAVKSVSRARH
jgi:hypothetical protein